MLNDATWPSPSVKVIFLWHVFRCLGIFVRKKAPNNAVYLVYKQILFKATMRHCKAILGRGQPELMRWIWVWVMSLVWIDHSCWSAVHCAIIELWLPHVIKTGQPPVWLSCQISGSRKSAKIMFVFHHGISPLAGILSAKYQLITTVKQTWQQLLSLSLHLLADCLQ